LSSFQQPTPHKSLTGRRIIRMNLKFGDKTEVSQPKLLQWKTFHKIHVGSWRRSARR